MRLLRKLLHVQRVHQAVDRHEHLSLIIIGVDPLADCDELHAGEIQPLEDPERVFRAPGEA
ncbi:MAG: hypothetical protein WA755_10380 [Candidatus Acidiferrales bacterium]